MANKTETRPRQGGNTVDRSAVLRKVMEVLSAKGFAKDVDCRLNKRSGTWLRRAPQGLRNQGRDSPRRDPVLRRHRGISGARAFARLADRQRSNSVDAGRECAVAPALAQILWLSFYVQRLYRSSEDEPTCRTSWRRSVVRSSKQIRSRLARSVREGELPESANCEALANLCLTLLSGLTFRVLDGTPPSLLFRSIELFVNGLGFTSPEPGNAPKVARDLARH